MKGHAYNRGHADARRQEHAQLLWETVQLGMGKKEEMRGETAEVDGGEERRPGGSCVPI